MLAAELGFVHVSTGQLLREDIKKNNTELNRKLEHRMQKGKLVPTVSGL
jgi:adenylate kinase family enzyme